MSIKNSISDMYIKFNDLEKSIAEFIRNAPEFKNDEKMASKIGRNMANMRSSLDLLNNKIFEANSENDYLSLQRPFNNY